MEPTAEHSLRADPDGHGERDEPVGPAETPAAMPRPAEQRELHGRHDPASLSPARIAFLQGEAPTTGVSTQGPAGAALLAPVGGGVAIGLTPPRRSSRRRIVARGVLGLVVAAAALTACGDGGEDDGNVSDADREDAMLEFTECMRDQGIDMPDPDEGGADPEDPDLDQEAFEEAKDECFYLIENVAGDAKDIDTEEEAERQDKALAYAACMRDHGIDVPDPEFSEGRGGMQLPEGVDPEDPDFKDAQDACQAELGFEPGNQG